MARQKKITTKAIEKPDAKTSSNEVVQRGLATTRSRGVLERGLAKTSPGKVVQPALTKMNPGKVVQRAVAKTSSGKASQPDPPKTNSPKGRKTSSRKALQPDVPRTSSRKASQPDPPKTSFRKGLQPEMPKTNSSEAVQESGKTNSSEAVQPESAKTSFSEAAQPQPAKTSPGEALKPDVARAQLVARAISVHSTDRILNYGSGDGRLAAALATMAGEVVGLDSDWAAIERCRTAWSTAAENLHFEAFQIAISETPPKVGTALHLSQNELASKYPEYFDLVCSFDAFARFELHGVARALRLLGRLLKRNGYLLFGCHIDMSFTPVDRTLETSTASIPGAVPITLSKLFALLRDEGFRPLTMSFGSWRTDRSTRSAQQATSDLVLAVRQPTAPADFLPRRYLELNPDVAAANIDPLEHYLLHGFYEGRKIS